MSGYVHPLVCPAILSAAFGVILIGFIVRSKKLRFKKKKLITMLLLIVGCFTIASFSILTINHVRSEGDKQWGKHMESYYECEEDQKKFDSDQFQVACEF